MLSAPMFHTAPNPAAAPACAGPGRLTRWWRRRAERAQRAAERRELLALDDQCRRDLGSCRVDEEAHKPGWRP